MKPGILLACLLLAAAGCGSKPAWEALPLGTKADFRGIWFTDALHGWIAGGSYEITGGLVGRTSDGGRSWKFVSNLTQRDGGSVQSIHFFDNERGIVTSSGAILTTIGRELDDCQPARPCRRPLQSVFSGRAPRLGCGHWRRDSNRRWRRLGHQLSCHRALQRIGTTVRRFARSSFSTTETAGPPG